MSNIPSTVRLRVPSALRSSAPSPPANNTNDQNPQIQSQSHHDDDHDDASPPHVAWMTASPWNVVYSSLPMWRSKRNVRITYGSLLSSKSTTTPSSTSSLPASNGQGERETVRISDLVTSQGLTSSRVQSIQGVDCAVPTAGERETWAWHWRGSGWLKIVSSRWEVLGYGKTDPDPDPNTNEGQRASSDWVVTYFAKTLFTPAGIDIYSRPQAAISERLLEDIKQALRDTGHEVLIKLADQLFLVKHDSNATSS